MTEARRATPGPRTADEAAPPPESRPPRDSLPPSTSPSLFSLLATTLLAYSVHEHQLGHVKRIDVWLRPRSFTVEDDGRGMGLHREGYVNGLMGQLVGSPVEVALHGLGLALIASSSPRLEVRSHRDGRIHMQSFAWGVPEGESQVSDAGPGSGTRVGLALAPDAADIEAEFVMSRIVRWREANPGLSIEVR